ncbi:unnamed protein product [Caenorhabditis bovis]|uniref:One cut domain family member n=1 Tax=Caenorhabditis bovis TaxID=2654633 RepID=A0A8S1F4Y3_9PELO|nr:unnamed protein product [Caenorhabditis bovis]
METLDTGGLSSDPLLSAALSSPPIVRSGHSNRRGATQSPSGDSFIDFADDGHRTASNTPPPMSTRQRHHRTIYGNYATLTTLQPLPPISTVTSKEQRYSRESTSPQTKTIKYFFPTNGAGNYNYEIKYEYEAKSSDDGIEEENGETHTSTPSDYGSSGQDISFASPTFEAYDRSPKNDKDTTFNFTSFPADCDDLGLSSHKSSPSLPTSYDEDDGEELNTKELATRISAELKRYSIPQAVFAARILCRSQGTLSDLLRNPKPWSKLKSGRETFRRMDQWLKEPEFERMSALRLAACKRKEEPSSTSPSAPKKPRLVFTDIQRRTLQAIFKETKRPSREMQLTISQQLNLDPTTVANFFMNARRRGHEMKMDDMQIKTETSSVSNDDDDLSLINFLEEDTSVVPKVEVEEELTISNGVYVRIVIIQELSDLSDKIILNDGLRHIRIVNSMRDFLAQSFVSATGFVTVVGLSSDISRSTVLFQSYKDVSSYDKIAGVSVVTLTGNIKITSAKLSTVVTFMTSKSQMMVKDLKFTDLDATKDCEARAISSTPGSHSQLLIDFSPQNPMRIPQLFPAKFFSISTKNCNLQMTLTTNIPENYYNIADGQTGYIFSPSYLDPDASPEFNVTYGSSSGDLFEYSVDVQDVQISGNSEVDIIILKNNQKELSAVITGTHNGSRPKAVGQYLNIMMKGSSGKAKLRYEAKSGASSIFGTHVNNSINVVDI